jgi:uncharacterized protein YlxP (DUF503 family)
MRKTLRSPIDSEARRYQRLTITTQTKITILNKDNTHTKKTLEKTTKLIDYKTSKTIILSAREKLRLNKK